MSELKPQLRCGVYTRTSTSENLVQDFNSIDAQKEACLAYVESQRGENWLALMQAYDDGGFSGGTLDRPAMQRLLADVREGLVDIIICYKIDRISRSLADFVGLVKFLDEHGVTFVSITQSFNTTTSMGRLTLNILLSFAQFERELGGERVRDKIAASRKRGIWMGGFPPLGYDVRDRKLVPNACEVKLVRHIFERFVFLRSVTSLVRELRGEGVTTKSWTTIKDKQRTGKLIDKGFLYKLFRNPTVIGIAAHKGQHYKGEHDAIIDRDLWNQVQALLGRDDPKARGRKSRESKAPSILKGILWASDGRAMTPGYTKKGDKLYRYYINTAAIKIGAEGCEIRRVPAGEIEGAVMAHVRRVLQAPEVVASTLCEAQALDPTIDAAQAIQTLQSTEAVWDELFPAEQAKIVQTLIQRVTISPTGIKIDFRARGMKELLESTIAVPAIKKAA